MLFWTSTIIYLFIEMNSYRFALCVYLHNH